MGHGFFVFLFFVFIEIQLLLQVVHSSHDAVDRSLKYGLSHVCLVTCYFSCSDITFSCRTLSL
jgi:hypothetical protein